MDPKAPNAGVDIDTVSDYISCLFSDSLSSATWRRHASIDQAAEKAECQSFCVDVGMS